MRMLIEQFMCLIEKISGTSKCAQRFNTDTDIYRREIHVIKLVGAHSGIYVSEIGRKFGVTKGAASQVLKKLEKKGLIQKYPDETNNTRLLVRLTDKGETAYQGHEEYHRQHDSEFFTFLAELNKHELETLRVFIEKIDKMWEEHL